MIRARFFVALITLAAVVPFACSSGDDSGGAQSSADGGGGSNESAIDEGGSDSPAAPLVCTPPAGNPPAGSPIIFEAPSPVAPGQVALLFGAKVGASAQVHGLQLPDSAVGLPPRLTDCVPPSSSSLDLVQADDLSAKVSIPSSWTPGTYALVVQNASGTSAPVVLNRARIDWVRGGPGNSLVSGSTFDVYGRSFGAQPSAWLADASGKATALVASNVTTAATATKVSDGYVATFEVPNLTAGSYTLYVHNGRGGPYGFSDPLTVDVAAASPWPTTVYAIAAGSGNDDNALAAAITLAKNNGGGIVEFATGNYTLTQGVTIPPKTVVRSASGNRSDVTLTFNETAIPFPYGFQSDGNFSIEELTVVSSSSARLVQCPTGADFLRDPTTGEPQYQPDAPCENARIHDVSMTLSTLRDLVTGGSQTTTPTFTLMIVINGNDCEISDSTLVDNGGGALSLAKANRLYVLRNTIVSGTTRTLPSTTMPLTDAQGSVGGGNGIYSARESAIVGNTIGPSPTLGAAATMFIEYDAHDLYIADNEIGPNLSDYGEGFSFDAPYYPIFLGLTTATTGRALTIPKILNAAGNNVFAGPADGTWTANTGTLTSSAGTSSLVGASVVVVNGTGLAQYAEIVSNLASAADGTTQITVDRDFVVPLDAASVIEIAQLKSKVVFARNSFHDVAVGAQLYAGGYDFIVDGTSGGAMEGTYCYAYDFMSQRASATDLQRRFTRCYFNQWINTTLNNQVDATYPWNDNAGPGVSTPFTNGLIGVHVSTVKDPLIPVQRGIGAIGNIIRGNDVSGFTLGFAYTVNGTLPSPPPTMGRDNVIEQNQTKSVPVGIYVDPLFPGTLIRSSTCASGCDAGVDDLGDGG